MCVILAAEKKKVKYEWLKMADQANPDGIGAAWLADGRVNYMKGMELKDIQKLHPHLEPPYVIHFRISTVGGKRKDLTHPFPIMQGVPLLERGTAQSVLFHNGHWNDWKEILMRSLSRGEKIPNGAWSDSRAMAFLVQSHGLGFLELIDNQRVAVLGAKKVIRFFGNGWADLNGVWASNKMFLSHKDWLDYSKPMGTASQCALPGDGFRVPGQNRMGFTHNRMEFIENKDFEIPEPAFDPDKELTDEEIEEMRLQYGEAAVEEYLTQRHNSLPEVEGAPNEGGVE